MEKHFRTMGCNDNSCHIDVPGDIDGSMFRIVTDFVLNIVEYIKSDI